MLSERSGEVPFPVEVQADRLSAESATPTAREIRNLGKPALTAIVSKISVPPENLLHEASSRGNTRGQNRNRAADQLLFQRVKESMCSPFVPSVDRDIRGAKQVAGSCPFPFPIISSKPGWAGSASPGARAA